MFGSVGCMLAMKGCLKGLCGMYQGHTKEATIILGVVASRDLWIWYAFFVISGSHNGINLLQRSLLSKRLCDVDAPSCNYIVNGHNYNIGYYLADDIYPQWAVFVKTIYDPHGKK